MNLVYLVNFCEMFDSVFSLSDLEFVQVLIWLREYTEEPGHGY